MRRWTPVVVFAAMAVGLMGIRLRAMGTGPGLTYIGHASVLLEHAGARVLTDPYWGKKILLGLKRRIPAAVEPENLPGVTMVLVSHTHPDHFDPEGIARLPGRPVLVMPWGRGRGMRKKGFEVAELRPGESYEKDGVRVVAVRARHMFGHCLGYLIRMGGRTIYFTGDTDLFKELGDLKKERVDVMVMPYGGAPVVGSIWTTKRAVEAVRRVSPRFVVPVHDGTFPRWWTRKQPPSPRVFLERIREETGVKAAALDVGETLVIPTDGNPVQGGHSCPASMM